VCLADFVLCESERQFACKHHQLIYGFLNRHGLPESDYYGVAALGYLRAVHRYFDRAELRRFSFSTVAYRAMLQSVSQHRRCLSRQAGAGNSISVDTGGIDGSPLHCGISAAERTAYEELEETLLLHALVQRLSPGQAEVVRLRLQGYGIQEIARRQAVSEKQIRSLLRQTREIFREVCQA
jgi:RNA polymerase sigma factor (sigma-70 family)